jgi:hypothetical protein
MLDEVGQAALVGRPPDGLVPLGPFHDPGRHLEFTQLIIDPIIHDFPSDCQDQIGCAPFFPHPE